MWQILCLSSAIAITHPLQHLRGWQFHASQSFSALLHRIIQNFFFSSSSTRSLVSFIYSSPVTSRQNVEINRNICVPVDLFWRINGIAIEWFLNSIGFKRHLTSWSHAHHLSNAGRWRRNHRWKYSNQQRRRHLRQTRWSRIGGIFQSPFVGQRFCSISPGRQRW